MVVPAPLAHDPTTYIPTSWDFRQYIYNSLLKAALGHYVMNATDIGHSDPSQNYEKMGTEFILLLLFDENIDILLCKNSQGSFNQRLSFSLMMSHFMSQNIISPH
jgi:hypothetical protein